VVCIRLPDKCSESEAKEPKKETCDEYRNEGSQNQDRQVIPSTGERSEETGDRKRNDDKRSRKNDERRYIPHIENLSFVLS
jgi:hypothetical protein